MRVYVVHTPTKQVKVKADFFRATGWSPETDWPRPVYPTGVTEPSQPTRCPDGVLRFYEGQTGATIAAFAPGEWEFVLDEGESDE